MRLETAMRMATLVAGLGLGGAAQAADMPAYNFGPAAEAPQGAPLTFGSGWYLRGDASFGPEDQPKLLVGPPARFGDDATPVGYGFGLGAGYQFNEFLRFDVTADYLDPFHYAAAAPYPIYGTPGAVGTLSQTTDVQRFDALVNGYVDLGSWWGISPYVGGGVGVGITRAETSATFNGVSLGAGMVDPRTGTVLAANDPNRYAARFAWAAMAGLTYPVSPHMLLDVGYRYLDLGRTPIPIYPDPRVSRDLTANQVRVGLRYVID